MEQGKYLSSLLVKKFEIHAENFKTGLVEFSSVQTFVASMQHILLYRTLFTDGINFVSLLGETADNNLALFYQVKNMFI